MNQIHKTDDYNLLQPSRTGRPGFESFKNVKDGRYYFHFNDAKGVAFLFSQAYQAETTRDKGIQSVVKNAAVEAQFEHQNTEGGFFFILRAGNRQEIARSRDFSSLKELEEKQTFLRQNLSLSAHKEKGKATIEPIENQAAKKPTIKPTLVLSPPVSVLEKTNNLEEIPLVQAGIKDAETKDPSDDTLRHIFRIEIYKSNTTERLYGKIIHPFSDQTQTFTGFDSSAILAFMTTKLQGDLPKTATTMKGNQPNSITTMPRPSPELSPIKALNLTNNSPFFLQNQPFALILTPLPNESIGVQAGQPCIVETHVFNLDTFERYKLLEKRMTVLSDANTQALYVRIEPLVLEVNSYRLSVDVRILSSDKMVTEAVQRWQGSIILQVN